MKLYYVVKKEYVGDELDRVTNISFHCTFKGAVRSALRVVRGLRKMEYDMRRQRNRKLWFGAYDDYYNATVVIEEQELVD